MTHEEISELLASYALDALPDDECRVVEEHLVHCPRCRAELDACRDVAAALGNSVAELPEGLWLSIVSRLTPYEDAPPAMPRLLPEPAGATSSTERRRLRWLSTRGGVAAVGSILGAAAATIAILSFALTGSNDEVSRLQASQTTQPTGAVSALETPGRKVIDLENGSGRRLARFVLADGRGYLLSSTLPALTAAETYQLWGIVSGQPISLGLLGHSPSNSVFTLAGSAVPTQLRITVEPSSGSVVPTGAAVASGKV